MRKSEIINRLIDSSLVAVIRGNSSEEGIRISEACIKGGIKGIEITYTNPSASEIISNIKKNHKDILIGAGSVLDEVTARTAIIAGADFIVSPAFDKNTAKICNIYQIPYIPGCMTLTEIRTAMSYGSEIIKLFPGSAMGPSFVKAIKAPLPQVNIMPTGGVSLDNVEEWFNSGVIGVGVGGKLTNGSDDEIIKTAQDFVKKIQEIKK